MNNFRGDALSWESKEGVIELGLHRPPANEIGVAMLGELEHFVPHSNRPAKKRVRSSSIAA